MTIKPIIPSQKAKDDGEEQNQAANSPSNREMRKSSIVFEDRHGRRTPQKSLNRLKRDHHQKRHDIVGGVRTGLEREKQTKSPYSSLCSLAVGSSTAATNNLGRASSPNVLGCNAGASASPAANHPEEACSGYNSGDEHNGRDAGLTEKEWKQRDEDFVKSMGKEKLIVKEIEEDGACLFRAISLQIYGDQDMHEDIRQQTMDYISQNREYFAQFVTEDITSYIARKRKKNVHGNHIEIQAMSEIYNRPVELYCYQTKPINIFNSEQRDNGYEPLRLSYQRSSHYNAILDPYKASVGVGLGLAGYKPDEVDLKQMHEAVRVSEQLEIEQTMFEDKLKTTDWDATNEAIEEQIARESYLQWCRENMQRPAKSVTATVTSSMSSSCGGGSSLGMPGSSSGATATAISGEVVSLIGDEKPLMPLLGTMISGQNNNNNGGPGTVVGNNNNNNLASAIAGRMSPKQYQSDDGPKSGSSSCTTSTSSTASSSSGSSSNSSELRQRRRRRRNQAKGELAEAAAMARGGVSRDSPLGMANLNLMETRSTDSNDSDVSEGTMKKKLKMRLGGAEEEQDHVENREPAVLKEEGAEKHGKHESAVVELTEPGPSRSAGGNTMAGSEADFYHSLLESSYKEDGTIQMSETEMIQRAIQMSRIDYISKLQKHSGYDSP